MKAAFIDDGYTITAYIEETEDYPRVEYTYRPPLHTETTQYLQEISRLNQSGRTAEAAREGCVFVANKIQSWNLPREPVPDTMKYLHPDLFAALYRVLLGADRPNIVEDAAKNSTAG